jgi:outer membrane immunogenic protein
MSKRLVGAVFAVVPHAKAAGTVTTGGSGSWTGLYVGAGIGGKWADTDWTMTCFGDACTTGGSTFFSPDASSPRTFSSSALRGSGYAGFNWQLQNWVLGVEGDVGFGDKSKVTFGIPGCTTDCGFLPTSAGDIDSASVKVLGDASIRGRAGFLVVPTVLVYGTAGAAFQRVSANITCNADGPWCSGIGLRSEIFSDTHSSTLKGWTAGGGLEWMVHDGWLVRGEYRYSDLGHFSPTFFEGTQNAVYTDIHVVTQELNFGLGYKF